MKHLNPSMRPVNFSLPASSNAPTPLMPPAPTSSPGHRARLQWLEEQYATGQVSWSELCALRDAPMYLP
ncbi:hypothetical protein DNI29_22400 [Hymenobacter sediminis]|uniref:hypothetical protein n=1 Tax=Hymenobacter sediminis TaxID=2218621 RepID=UPI000DA668C9|nr:hypothetical protein [Hymenobacter sediminis]RPD44150.1 hypothetical protein DNI29_22400 [Hymenobacter sediminis]